MDDGDTGDDAMVKDELLWMLLQERRREAADAARRRLARDAAATVPDRAPEAHAVERGLRPATRLPEPRP